MNNIILNSQKGFGLIEIMVGVAILAISGLAMMSLLEQNVRSTATIEAKLGKVALAQDIRTEISRAATCKLALADVNQYVVGADRRVPMTFRFSNNLTVPSEKTKDHYSLVVSRFYFVPNDSTITNLPDGRTEVMGDLMFESEGKSAGALKHQPISAGRVILRHNGPTIDECGSENALGINDGRDCEAPASFLGQDCAAVKETFWEPPVSSAHMTSHVLQSGHRVTLTKGGKISEGTTVSCGSQNCQLGCYTSRSICINGKWSSTVTHIPSTTSSQSDNSDSSGGPGSI